MILLIEYGRRGSIFPVAAAAAAVVVIIISIMMIRAVPLEHLISRPIDIGR